MPCHAAMIEKPVTLKPDVTVEKALKELKKKKIDTAAVVDDDGVMIGVFSVNSLIKNLLPVSVAVNDGIQLDVKMPAAPGIAKRLKKVYPVTIDQLMERKFEFVYPETPIWEAINLLVLNKLPIFVVENENNKFLGMIDFQSTPY